MTVDQFIALASSIGACLSAIAALFAVLQATKHSKASYRPELVIPTIIFKSECEDGIPNNWEYDGSSSKYAEPGKAFGVPLRNVGLGAAKEIKISIDFPIEEMVNNANLLIHKSTSDAVIKYENEIVTMVSNSFGDTVSVWKNQKDEIIDFILPLATEDTPVRVNIPHAYMLIASSMVYFGFKAGEAKFLDGLPLLKLKISYSDIGGYRYDVSFDLKVGVDMVYGKGEGFEGYVQASRI